VILWLRCGYLITTVSEDFLSYHFVTNTIQGHAFPPCTEFIHVKVTKDPSLTTLISEFLSSHFPLHVLGIYFSLPASPTKTSFFQRENALLTSNLKIHTRAGTLKKKTTRECYSLGLPDNIFTKASGILHARDNKVLKCFFEATIIWISKSQFYLSTGSNFGKIIQGLSAGSQIWINAWAE